MPWSWPVALGHLLGALTLALPAESVARAQLNAGPAAPDSAAVLRQARNAQHQFESSRRAHLPRTSEDGGGSHCDARIGRFCYWYSAPSGDTLAEPPVIGEARAALLHELEAAAARMPGDDWIAGQQVRYLVEQRRPDLALAAVQRCRGTGWWCAALGGFVLHSAGDYAAADSAYAHALAIMPEEERCRWVDLSDVLEEDAGRYRKLACAERDDANATIWWLSDPLLAVPGNDLRTEHYARLTISRTLVGADTPHGSGWSWDMGALIVRYGWPEAWTRPFSTPPHVAEPSIIGHQRSPSFWFFAAAPLVPRPGAESRPVTWELERAKPRARYAPRYASAFGSIGRAQIARFRRGAGAITLAAYDLHGDTLVGGPDLQVALAVALGPSTPPAVSPTSDAEAGVVMVQTRWMPALVSLEAGVRKRRRIARTRVLASDLESPSSIALSDLLLLHPMPDGVADSLPAVAPAALSEPAIVVGSRIGLYWEVYGVPASEPVQIEVRAERGSGKRTASALLGTRQCQGQAGAPARLGWVDQPRGSPRPLGRSVVLDLSQFKPGRYQVTVAVSAGAAPAVCAGRELEIRKR